MALYLFPLRFCFIHSYGLALVAHVNVDLVKPCIHFHTCSSLGMTVVKVNLPPPSPKYLPQ